MNRSLRLVSNSSWTPSLAICYQAMLKYYGSFQQQPKTNDHQHQRTFASSNSNGGNKSSVGVVSFTRQIDSRPPNLAPLQPLILTDNDGISHNKTTKSSLDATSATNQSNNSVNKANNESSTPPIATATTTAAAAAAMGYAAHLPVPTSIEMKPIAYVRSPYTVSILYISFSSSRQ
jgi:hypothetical protein